MLTTLIYRSHIADDVPVKILGEMVARASMNNAAHDVTGILLFNGTHFFQLLEGPEKGVMAVYARICADKKHHNLVKLMRDYAPRRRFGNAGMELFDLRDHTQSTVLEAVLERGTSRYQLTYEDRALQFLRTFVLATERVDYFEVLPAEFWQFQPDARAVAPQLSAEDIADRVVFAFQPIVDPLAREVVAVEAILPATAAAEMPAAVTAQEKYQRDLQVKKNAFDQAVKLGIDNLRFSVNLLPMTLVEVPGALTLLLNTIADSGLIPEQVTVEISENEILSRTDDFALAIHRLKSSGISLTIDNFGAGSAGLLLLSHVQPERIKIASEIIRDVHKRGPNQAIVLAIMKCCSSLEIAVTADGVEQPEEWMWLEAAGISSFQGSLFAAPALGSIPVVSWPELREE